MRYVVLRHSNISNRVYLELDCVDKGQ